MWGLGRGHVQSVSRAGGLAQTLLTVAQGVAKRRAQVAVASTRNRVPVLNPALRAGCVPAGGAGERALRSARASVSQARGAAWGRSRSLGVPSAVRVASCVSNVQVNVRSELWTPARLWSTREPLGSSCRAPGSSRRALGSTGEPPWCTGEQPRSTGEQPGSTREQPRSRRAAPVPAPAPSPARTSSASCNSGLRTRGAF